MTEYSVIFNSFCLQGLHRLLTICYTSFGGYLLYIDGLSRGVGGWVMFLKVKRDPLGFKFNMFEDV